jgi:hypothetical protein
MDEQPQEVEVKISDIYVLKQAIEVAARRGAFQADEMATVGDAYNKVAEWLSSVMPEEQDQADSTGETDA